MVSLKEGFLLSETAAFSWGKAGAECSINVCLNTSGEGLSGLFGGGEYSESRVVWKMFKNCSGCG